MILKKYQKNDPKVGATLLSEIELSSARVTVSRGGGFLCAYTLIGVFYVKLGSFMRIMPLHCPYSQL